MMSFDECVKWPSTHEYMEKSVERTLRWAKRGKSVKLDNDQLLFGIVQGGEYPDLRKHCAEELVKMDFDGYSIGGTSVGEDKKTQYKMVRYATSYLPKDKVRYLMGVGDPIDIVENVCNGIDIFDCVSPTRLARHGHALTRFGKINIKNAKYKEDFTPIEDACTCYACQNYTKAYIKHLINCEETFGARLLSIHNIHYLINLTEELRQAIIAGNWKMNKTRSEAKTLIEDLKPIAEKATCGVVICVPYTNLETAVELTKGTNIKVGAENVHFKKSGAFTGEISADMLTEMGVEYVIIGHSERRQYFGETDLTVNRRVKAALAAGLKVILCVGEMLSEREDGITEDVVELQTVAAFTGVSEEDAKNVIIAYEPVWAIGTGKTATAEQANEVCSFIRGVVAKRYNKAVADGMTIQYGGSMNPKNAAELLAQPDVDGGLIGGASLKAADFGVLLEEASK